MFSDAERWDRKYSSQTHGYDLTPDPLLTKHAHLFKPGKCVVDLASGLGRNALYIAKLGCRTIAVDCSLVALQHCRVLALEANLTLQLIVADLNEFRFPPRSVDAMICVNYLNRDLASNIVSALKPDGLVFMTTFNRNYSSVNPSFNPDYMLDSGELSALFDGLEIIFLDDQCATAENTKSSIVACRINTQN